MKLIEYMPPFLKNIREYNKIFEAEDIELEKIREQVNLMLTEKIVNLATSFGLDRYEKIYNIKSTPDATVETRRINILMKMNCKIPYTYSWLIELLNTSIRRRQLYN